MKAIPLEQIHTEKQARAHFPGLASLADSIAELGQLQPLIVREVNNTRYDLIAGERRLRALRLLHERDPARWKTADCTVLPVDSDPAVELLIQLVENEQREPLHTWERGAGYRAAHELGAPWSLIASRCGTSVAAVKRDAAIAAHLHPSAVAVLQSMPRDHFKPSALQQIAAQRDELGKPDPEKQLAWIRQRPTAPPRGTYDRALERRRVAAKLQALEVDLIPTLSVSDRRVAAAVIAYLRRGGPVRAFRWEDFDR